MIARGFFSCRCAAGTATGTATARDGGDGREGRRSRGDSREERGVDRSSGIEFVRAVDIGRFVPRFIPASVDIGRFVPRFPRRWTSDDRSIDRDGGRSDARGGGVENGDDVGKRDRGGGGERGGGGGGDDERAANDCRLRGTVNRILHVHVRGRVLGHRGRAFRHELVVEDVEKTIEEKLSQRRDEAHARFTIHDGGTRSHGMDQSLSATPLGHGRGKFRGSTGDGRLAGDHRRFRITKAQFRQGGGTHRFDAGDGAADDSRVHGALQSDARLHTV